MDYITTTQLRTKSPQILEALRRGDTIKLVHRSKIVGKISPPEPEPKVFKAKEFRKLFKGIKPFPYIPYKKREEIYRKHLEEKYGKHLS